MAQDRLGVCIGLDEGCSSARISRYETGIHQPPFEVAEKLAGVLGVPAAYLYCGDDRMAEIVLGLAALSGDELDEIQRSIRQMLEGRNKR